MDIQTLKIALLVHAHGSFAGAARVLNVDPSSVSRAVAALETDLGVRLFQRTTRQLSMTDAGRAFLARIAPLVEELTAAADAARNAKTQPTGQVRLTASTAYASEVLVPRLVKFHAAYPEIKVTLLSTDATLDLVEHDVDLAIRLTPQPTGDVVATRLHETTYHLVASPDCVKAHPIKDDPRKLAECPCLTFSLPGVDAIWRFRKGDRNEVVVPVSGPLSGSNALSLREAARAGLGYALLADWMVAQDLVQGRLVSVLPDHTCLMHSLETAAWALYPSRRYLPQKVRVLIDFLKVHARDA